MCSGLEEAAKAARAKAEVSVDPSDHQVALALEGALAAARLAGHEPADPGPAPPSPEESGYPASLRIPPGETGSN